MITRWVAGVAVLFGILLMMLPKTDDASVAKIGSAAMLMCTKDFRAVVGQQVLRDDPVTAEFNNTCPDLIAGLTVSDTGELVITGKKHPLTMTLRPAVDGESVRWSCRGEPAQFITNLCKP